MALVMRSAATNVSEGVIPGAGHWLMEEQPEATVKMVVNFSTRPPDLAQLHLRRHRQAGA
jgi:pimeloyl-ACP methyl ester carboxylesterase